MSAATENSIRANTVAALARIVEPGQVVELRAIGVKRGTGRPHPEAGFFDTDHLEEMARAALSLTPHAKGIYLTLNPLAPDLLARRCNRTDFAGEGELSKDKDILRRRWLLIDADPIRDALVSATDDEKAAAQQVIVTVREFLTARGWPAPLYCDSGNGFHLLYRIDLPADDAGTVEHILQALAARFDDADVKIDKTVFNPARICKIPGTLARKGDSTPARPHRRSAILEAPDEMGIVPADLLAALAAEAPAPPPPPPRGKPRPSPSAHGPYNHRLDVAKYLSARGVEFRVKDRPDGKGRTVYVLAECPFDSSHRDPDSCVMQAADGELSAQCFHNSCSGRGWQEFKRQIGVPDGDHYDPPISMNGSTRRGQSHPQDETPPDEEEPPPPDDQHGDAYEPPPDTEGPPPDQEPTVKPIDFGFLDSAAFVAAEFKLEWLVRRLLVRNQPAVLGGPKKSLKTSVLVDLALSLGTGQPFLTHFRIEKPVRVAVLSGESGPATLKETALRVADSKGIDLADATVSWSFKLPQLADTLHLLSLKRALQEMGAEVVIVDPLYLCLLGAVGRKGPQASNLYETGPLFLAVAETCLSIGCTPILAHHFKLTRADQFAEPQLEDLAFSGIQEFVRQWALVGRRERYEPGSGAHRLWLNVGGSAGQSGLWTLNIDEGAIGEDFTGRQWLVEVQTAADTRAEDRKEQATAKQQKQQAQDTADEVAVLHALDLLAHDSDDGTAGYTQVRAGARLSGDRMLRATMRLKEREIVEEVTVSIATGTGLKVKKEVRGLRRKREEATDGTDGTDPLFS